MFRNKKLSYKNPLYCDNEKSPWNKYYYYYPVKIFFCFWLAKIPCTIHCPRRAKSRGDMLVAARVCRKVLTVEICSQPLKKKISICLIRSHMESLSNKMMTFVYSRPQARDFLGWRKTDYRAEWLLFSGHCTYSRARSIAGAWTESLLLRELNRSTIGIVSIWIALKLCLNISWHLVLYKSLQFIWFKYPSSAKSS